MGDEFLGLLSYKRTYPAGAVGLEGTRQIGGRLILCREQVVRTMKVDSRCPGSACDCGTGFSSFDPYCWPVGDTNMSGR